MRGLDLFREHFREFGDRYVLIGGTACDLVMREAGLAFRATKDLDVVLCVEALDATFATAIWEFVTAGQYEVGEKATGERRFYRFQKPRDERYPAMLELFSRVPDLLSLVEGSRLTPIPVDDVVSSLSAILLDGDYYEWIRSGVRELEGVPIVGPEYLVPLKARAWLDLSARKEAGEKVDSRSIRKHRNDVFRLSQVLDPERVPRLPERIESDTRGFLDGMAAQEVDPKALGLGPVTRDSVVTRLRGFYGLG